MATYTLITVTYGGQVHHSRGYETLYMCEQARSIALTGMTIEQNEAADLAYESANIRAAAEWRERHPPYSPTSAEDLELVERYAKGYFTLSSTSNFKTLGRDGLIYEWPGSGSAMSPSYNSNRGEAVVYVRGGWVKKHATDIKDAFCVIEPENV